MEAGGLTSVAANLRVLVFCELLLFGFRSAGPNNCPESFLFLSYSLFRGPRSTVAAWCVINRPLAFWFPGSAVLCIWERLHSHHLNFFDLLLFSASGRQLVLGVLLASLIDGYLRQVSGGCSLLYFQCPYMHPFQKKFRPGTYLGERISWLEYVTR